MQAAVWADSSSPDRLLPARHLIATGIHTVTAPHYDIAILGAGLGGLGMASRLRAAGRTDFVILEQSDRLGGTWRDNTYPGAGCDVQSHLYCYSFAIKRDWSHVYCLQPEILRYIEDFAENNRLVPHIRFNHEISEARWDGGSSRWHLRIRQGGSFTARIFIAAWGQLNRPVTPAIDGHRTFAGQSFHSARWRHDVDLAGKRIGVIGTGASAAQLVPEIAGTASHVALFQRTPNWIVPRMDRPYTEEELAAFRTDDSAFFGSRDSFYRERENRFTRHWLGSDRADETRKVALDHLHAQVPDPDLRTALTPDYPIGCKRILISDDFYPALLRHDVTLVTSPIEGITAAGIATADGRMHACDIIVYATGFETHSFQGPVDVFGRNGGALRDVWSEAPEAYLGIVVAGFPNFFMLYGPNTNLSHNTILEMLEAQIRYILQALERLDESRALDVRPDVLRRFNDRLQADFAGTSWTGGCKSWYVRDGRVINNWVGSVEAYKARTARLDPEDFVTAASSDARPG